MRALLLPLWPLLLAGCYLADPCGQVLCGPCQPALTLLVSDASNSGPVAGVSVSGAEFTCTGSHCTTSGAGAGTYDLTLSAEGYVTKEVTVEVPSVDTSGTCCGCGYEPQTVTVELVPQ